MFQRQDQTPNKHIGVHEAPVHHVDKLIKLLVCGEDGVKGFEGFNVELNELPKQVKATLEDFFVPNFIFNYIACNMLETKTNVMM